MKAYYSITKKERNLAICDNVEDLEGIMLREISHMEKRQISYDLAHMQNIKNKQKYSNKCLSMFSLLKMHFMYQSSLKTISYLVIVLFTSLS